MKKRCCQFFYAILIVVFTCLVIKILWFDTVHQYQTGRLFVFMLAGLLLFGVSYFLLKKAEKWLERYDRFLVPVCTGIYFMIVLTNGFKLRFTPTFDMDAIYGGAIEWLKEGSFPDYYEYFGYFPNNLGAMGFLRFFFGIAKWSGITDFFAVGIVVNSLFIAMTMFVTSRICRRLFGSVAGVMAVVVFAMCVPFYFMGAAFYTDSLSLLFPVLFYWLYLIWREKEDSRDKWLYAFLMAVVLAIGMLIKFTVAIVLVAVLIDALINVGLRRTVFLAGVSIATVFIIFQAFYSYLYKAHLDKAQCQELKTPYLHWVMMGLQNNGYYSPEDYEYTRSFSAEERNEACLREIKNRVDNLGFTGLFDLFVNKAVVCFGDGTYALSDFLDDNPDEERDVHKYILYAGEKYGEYIQAATGILLAVYVLGVLGAAVSLFYQYTGADDAFWQLAPRLSMLGILAFLILWETSGRYFTNFVPMFLISAVSVVSMRRLKSLKKS